MGRPSDRERQLERITVAYRGIVNKRNKNIDDPPSNFSCQCCGRSKEAIIRQHGRFKKKHPGAKTLNEYTTRAAEFLGLERTDSILAIKFRCLQAHGEVYTNWECRRCWFKDDQWWSKMVISRGRYAQPEPVFDIPLEVPPDWHYGWVRGINETNSRDWLSDWKRSVGYKDV